LVKYQRKLAVGSDFPTDEVGNHLFVGRTKAEVSVISILKSEQLVSIKVPPAAFLPKLCGLNPREQ
jgi:hypothetical protein